MNGALYFRRTPKSLADVSKLELRETMIAAVIPARGGSKRLPRKNLRSFAGRPLIYYSIELARSITEIDRCVVSTEDEEIAAVALDCGAEVVVRPAELASDVASTASVVQHALSCLVEQGDQPELVITLQPNCPLRPGSLIPTALNKIREAPDAIDSVIAVSESGHKRGQLKDGYYVPGYEIGVRVQDMAPKYYENGLLFVTWARRVLEQGDLFGQRIWPIITDQLYGLSDIDTELDFQIAEFLFHKYRDCFAWAPPTPQEVQHQQETA
jgi:N-acylneuraminate cytidylyltransferase